MIEISGAESYRDELSRLVAKEVQRVLALYDQVLKAQPVAFPGLERGDKVAVNRLAMPDPQSIHDDLTGLASEFVHRLAAETVRCSDAGAEEMNALAAQAEEQGGHAAIEAADPQLDAMRIEDWAGKVAGPTYLERRFGIPRSTLYWWQRHNDVVALRKGARKHVFPLAQFIDGRPAPGIRQVLSLVANHRVAWLWLIHPSPLLNGRVPMEMLRQDMAADVVVAAQRFSSAKSL